MTDKTTSAPVAVADTAAAIVAAMSRIDEVSVSGTLIDSISDEEWMSDDIENWKIEAGSGDTAEIGLELDCCDNDQMNGNAA